MFSLKFTYLISYMSEMAVNDLHKERGQTSLRNTAIAAQKTTDGASIVSLSNCLHQHLLPCPQGVKPSDQIAEAVCQYH